MPKTKTQPKTKMMRRMQKWPAASRVLQPTTKPEGIAIGMQGNTVVIEQEPAPPEVLDPQERALRQIRTDCDRAALHALDGMMDEFANITHESTRAWLAPGGEGEIKEGAST